MEKIIQIVIPAIKWLTGSNFLVCKLMKQTVLVKKSHYFVIPDLRRMLCIAFSASSARSMNLSASLPSKVGIALISIAIIFLSFLQNFCQQAQRKLAFNLPGAAKVYAKVTICFEMTELGFDITLHDKMPDVVLYRADKNWLYFIEAVDSVGPMSPERIIDIQRMTRQVECGKIFGTAFLDFKKYKRFSEQIAWETEVWIAEMPDHMIHLNGDKFLGPRKRTLTNPKTRFKHEFTRNT